MHLINADNDEEFGGRSISNATYQFVREWTAISLLANGFGPNSLCGTRHIAGNREFTILFAENEKKEKNTIIVVAIFLRIKR